MPTALMVNDAVELAELLSNDMVDDLSTPSPTAVPSSPPDSGIDVALTARGTDLASALADGIAVVPAAFEAAGRHPVTAVLRADVSTYDDEQFRPGRTDGRGRRRPLRGQPR